MRREFLVEHPKGHPYPNWVIKITTEVSDDYLPYEQILFFGVYERKYSTTEVGRETDQRIMLGTLSRTKHVDLYESQGVFVTFRDQDHAAIMQRLFDALYEEVGPIMKGWGRN